MRKSMILLLSAFSLSLFACDKLRGSDNKTDEKSKVSEKDESADKSKKKKSKKSSESETDDDEEQDKKGKKKEKRNSETTASASVDAPKVAEVAELSEFDKLTPTPRSPNSKYGAFPTPKEWNAAEIAPITHAQALGCEGRTVRSWLRFACKADGLTQIQPKDASPTDSATFADQQRGMAIWVTPFAEGSKLEAKLAFTDESHTFSAFWPEKQPRPNPVGSFERSSENVGKAATLALVGKNGVAIVNDAGAVHIGNTGGNIASLAPVGQPTAGQGTPTGPTITRKGCPRGYLLNSQGQCRWICSPKIETSCSKTETCTVLASGKEFVCEPKK